MKIIHWLSCTLVFLLLFGCGGGDNSEPDFDNFIESGNANVKYIVTDNPDLPIVFSHINGETFSLVSSEETGTVDGILWSDPAAAASAYLTISPEGLPVYLTFNDFVIVFGNYRDSERLIDAILITPNQQRYSIPDLQYDTSQLSQLENGLTGSPRLSKQLNEGIEHKAFTLVGSWNSLKVATTVTIRGAALVLNTAMCAGATVVAATETLTGPAVLFVPATLAIGCAGATLQVLDLIEDWDAKPADWNATDPIVSQEAKNILSSTSITSSTLACLASIRPAIDTTITVVSIDAASCLDIVLTSLDAARKHLEETTFTFSGVTEALNELKNREAAVDEPTDDRPTTAKPTTPTAILCPSELGDESDVRGVFKFVSFEFETVNSSGFCIYKSEPVKDVLFSTSILISTRVSDGVGCGANGDVVFSPGGFNTVGYSTTRFISVTYGSKTDRSREENVIRTILASAVASNVGEHCP